MQTARARITVNGTAHDACERDLDRPLLWYLRDRLGLVGTKFGCGHGGCGACTVQVDGDAVAACAVTVADVAGKQIRTIEGLAQQPDHPIFRAWLAEQVPQCGYCQPGIIMATAALLEHTPEPTDTQIDAALAPVLCRCGSYQRVRRAVHRAAEQRWEGAPFPASALPPPAPPAGARVRFNPWVSIAADGAVIVTIERSEMGQGVTTALAMLVAEELDVSLAGIRTEPAPVDRAYDNPVIGMQITVGSMSMQNAWQRVRRAGADARARLVAVAAARWNVAPDGCRTESGHVLHPDGRQRFAYGALAEEAAALPPTGGPPLKDAARFAVLGRPAARLEIPDHCAGRTIFGMDVRLPGMLAATMLLAPVLGARPVAFDASAARAIAGVRDVFALDDGVAIVADDLWSAFRGREAVTVTWSAGDEQLSTEGVRAELRAALQARGTTLRNDGDVAAAFRDATAVHEARFETPYLAHAPIEPITATARIAGGQCDVWVPTQGQTLAQAAAARAAGLPPEAVNIHTTFIGGGFGRRSVPDVVAQAVAVAKRVAAPVQLVWTRADDIRHDRFRPAGMTLMRARLDGAGFPAALLMRVAGPKLAGEGVDIPYSIPNLRAEFVEADPGVPTGYWRSVGASQNAFAVEAFVDELAAAARIDPVVYRCALLGASPRHRAVLELAAAKAGWGRPRRGRAQGVAVSYAHGGWAAQVAEVSIRDSALTVHRVVCAVDCGFAINPDTVAAQIEGAIVFALTATLKSAIALEHGRVVQSGFRDYPLLMFSEMPQIEVHVLSGREEPTGAGECGVPPAAPAVANAVFAATGKRVRSLPIPP